MLQQTQASRVVAYYERFLARFPTLSDLAQAQWRQVLPLWRGLGYYRRARNLLESAKRIRVTHGGIIPHDTPTLLTLPGIGKYTASAVQSFAFGLPIAAVDTNLTRVFSRISPTDPEAPVHSLFRSRKTAHELNHAFMDLGATICTPKKPRCVECPLTTLCPSAFSIIEDSSSKTTPRRAQSDLTTTVVALISQDDEILVERQGSHFELPHLVLAPRENYRHALRHELLKRFGLELAIRPPFHTLYPTPNQRVQFCRAQVLRGIKLRRGRWIKRSKLCSTPLGSRARAGLASILAKESKKHAP